MHHRRPEDVQQQDLLKDVPHRPVVVETHHTIGGGDVVESCCLLVAKHHLRDPDSIPRVVFELEHRAVVIGGAVETQSRVDPLLAQIHAHRVVLYKNTPRPENLFTQSPITHCAGRL